MLQDEDEELLLSFDDESNDENIPVFLTCDKCCQVFGRVEDAHSHEAACTNNVEFILSDSSPARKKFLEIHSLVQYLIDLGRTVREADYVYYIPPSVSDEDEENITTDVVEFAVVGQIMQSFIREECQHDSRNSSHIHSVVSVSRMM
jgi:hypothetical protein